MVRLKTINALKNEAASIGIFSFFLNPNISVRRMLLQQIDYRRECWRVYQHQLAGRDAKSPFRSIKDMPDWNIHDAIKYGRGYQHEYNPLTGKLEKVEYAN